MQRRFPILLALAATVATLSPAVAAADTGIPATRAGRIVGTWLVSGQVSGANCTPPSPAPAIPIRVYLMFHAGGTLTELPRLPTNTDPAPRSFGVGHWHYDASDTYYATFRFDWYADGVLTTRSSIARSGSAATANTWRALRSRRVTSRAASKSSHSADRGLQSGCELARDQAESRAITRPALRAISVSDPGSGRIPGCECLTRYVG